MLFRHTFRLRIKNKRIKLFIGVTNIKIESIHFWEETGREMQSERVTWRV